MRTASTRPAAASAPQSYATMNAGASIGRMPAKVSLTE
jgi:hypothetical protein